MIGQGAPALRQFGSKQDLVSAAANFVNRVNYGTLILDRLGRILSCGVSVEKIFRASQVRLIGARVSEFIAGLLLGGSSPSYGARYSVYLCADGKWRKFMATDASGHEFAVELNLTRTVTEEQDIFLLNVRRPEETTRL